MASGSEGSAAAAGMGGGDSQPRPLTEADASAAAALTARAFAWHEPWGEFTFPDPSDREERMRELIEADIRERFLPYGENWTVGQEKLMTLTLWIPPSDTPDAKVFARRRSEEDYATYGEREPVIRAIDDFIRSGRPSEPHWFLDTIATEPELFGRGLAGRLLAHDLELRDEAGELCALDTHTPRQIAFYERHGFEVVARGEPAPGFPVVVMAREPRSG